MLMEIYVCSELPHELENEEDCWEATVIISL